ncbi:uncharacterized protein LOC121737059 [Aricia agestis]|uniref:uncharacterized protein LOC121737059 n=1 Tax=Aricia agestis TaxID=91739 RepID=UPI001C203300|nr:uncharacterized protein LOC121737059 [Aricia agestis]XP_041984535.1 uncharacterized protein LOC121737059 [Aricia agestis]
MSEHVILLRNLLVKIANEQCFKDGYITYNSIENDGSNYTSALFTATISAENKENLNLFAKVATIGEKMRDDSPVQVFKIETYFYTKLLQMYRNIEDEYKIPEGDRLKTPKFYGSNDEYLKEILVLENMLANGYQVTDRFKPMSGEFALQGVKELAKFHALSMALATHYPEEFEATREVLRAKESDAFKKFLSGISATVIETTEDNKKDLVTKLVKSVVHREDLNRVISSTDKAVLVHADYRGSNLLYRNNGTELEIAILDFQTITFGTPVFDLLYFLLNGADKDFLDKWYHKSLEKYYSELASALSKFKIDNAKTFSREDFDKEIQRMLPINLVLGFCSLLIVTVDAEEAPKLDEDLDLSKFGLVTPSKVYKKRLNGILEYFIQEGTLT